MSKQDLALLLKTWKQLRGVQNLTIEQAILAMNLSVHEYDELIEAGAK